MRTGRTTIRIAMATERTSRIATQDTDTHHLAHGPGMDTRTNRGLGPDHPRIRTLRRGGRAETASSQRGYPMSRAEQYRYLEATVRARAWNETSPAIRGGWMNLAEAYGRVAEHAEEASGADLTHPLPDPLDHADTDAKTAE